MRINLFTVGRRICTSVFSTLWRSRVSAIFFSVSLAFLFLFVHILSFGGILSQAIIENFEKKADIPIVIDQQANDTQISEFRKALQNKKDSKSIIDFWELSREDALKEFKKRYPSETSFIEKYGIQNPLVTVFGVTAASNSLATHELESWILSDIWHGTVDQKRFRKTTELRNRVDRFLHLTAFSEQGILIFQIIFIAIACALLFYSVFIIVRSHREEISIMRLVGAQFFYIRAPFVLEGLILSFVGLLLSLLFFWWFFAAFSGWVQNVLNELGIAESFVIDIFQNSSLLSQTLLHSSLLLLFFSMIAAILGAEHALRKTSLSN